MSQELRQAVGELIPVSALPCRGKTVLVRVDYNVPMADGVILDDTRITATLPTLNLLLEGGAKVVIATHLGRPKGKVVDELSVAPVAGRLSDLLGRRIPVAGDVAGSSARRLVEQMQPGDLLMLENVRFEAGEESNDPAFAAALASLADCYVNDAFATAHRAHASTAGVARLLPSAAGLLMMREIEVLQKVLTEPARPFLAIVGGAKVGSKVGLLRSLLGKVDLLWVVGAMAMPFFVALGKSSGSYPVEEAELQMAKELLEAAREAGATLRLPVDCRVAASMDAPETMRAVAWDAIPTDMMSVDIGPETLARLLSDCATARTVVWNGPPGVYEVEQFSHGTTALATGLSQMEGAAVVVGGGDAVAAVERAGVASRMHHVSTGGGATLEFMEKLTLPGIEALRGAPAEPLVR